MSRREVCDCDRCGLKDINPLEIGLCVDQRMDAAEVEARKAEELRLKIERGDPRAGSVTVKVVRSPYFFKSMGGNR